MFNSGIISTVAVLLPAKTQMGHYGTFLLLFHTLQITPVLTIMKLETTCHICLKLKQQFFYVQYSILTEQV